MVHFRTSWLGRHIVRLDSETSLGLFVASFGVFIVSMAGMVALAEAGFDTLPGLVGLVGLGSLGLAVAETVVDFRGIATGNLWSVRLIAFATTWGLLGPVYVIFGHGLELPITLGTIVIWAVGTLASVGGAVYLLHRHIYRHRRRARSHRVG